MRKKVVAYVRVSTDDQAKYGFSIEAQKKVLKDFADGRGLRIVKTFVGSESAFKAGTRPVFAEMVEFIRQHKAEIRGVLCYKIDRISRNLTDFAKISEMEGVELISATEPLPEGSTGTLIAGVQAVFARHSSQVSGERVSLGMRTKAEKGLWPSTAPLGYLNDRETKTIVPDPSTEQGIVALFEAYANGKHTLKDAARLVRELGLRGKRDGSLSRSQVYWILTNPIYYGDFVWKGKRYHGVHKPLISQALFDRVQERLRSCSNQRERRDFPFRGILSCGYCGCRITAERHTKKGKEYIYYRCTNGRGKCRQPWVNEETLSSRLGQVVAHVSLSEEQVSWLLQMLSKDSAERIRSREERMRRLQRERQSLERRRDDAYTDKLDGKLSEERWLRLDRDWEARAHEISQQIELLQATTEPQLDKAAETFELLKRAPTLYKQQDPYDQARFLRELVSNCEMKGDILVPVYYKPFDAVAVGLQTGDWYAQQDSNHAAESSADD